MTKKEAKRVRTLGKILFILYIIFLVYFLFLSDWYGREGVMDEYHYNLVLFKEIKRFIKYRHQLGTFAVFSNLFGNILIFMPVGYFSAMAGKRRSFFKTLFWSFCLTFCVELMQLITKVGCFDADDILLNRTPLDNTVNASYKEVANPFRQPHFIILNLALGATGGDLDKLPLPQKYEIDYVRIYQKKDSPHKGTIPYRAEK